MTTETNGRFVSKNWLIAVLVSIVTFLAGMGLHNQLGDVNAVKDMTTINRDAIQVNKTNIAVLQARYETIIEKLDRIEAKIDNDKK